MLIGRNAPNCVRTVANITRKQFQNDTRLPLHIP
ncbi:hypothetical protein ILFOPFJJ_04331 [Ensifer psoraleae]|nr:hypothetical protein [Sinorhizobium psoraleae]